MKQEISMWGMIWFLVTLMVLRFALPLILIGLVVMIVLCLLS